MDNYKKMPLMLGMSFIIMYGIMFLNVDDSSHIFLSLTRLYMALLMVAPMAVIMILLMPMMYKNRKKNTAIIVGAIIVFSFSLFFLRAQTFISDEQYMRAMIPHHSSAILTSKNADIKDPEVKKLSEQIIKSQEEEIKQMKSMLKRIENE